MSRFRSFVEQKNIVQSFRSMATQLVLEAVTPKQSKRRYLGSNIVLSPEEEELHGELSSKSQRQRAELMRMAQKRIDGLKQFVSQEDQIKEMLAGSQEANDTELAKKMKFYLKKIEALKKTFAAEADDKNQDLSLIQKLFRGQGGLPRPSAEDVYHHLNDQGLMDDSDFGSEADSLEDRQDAFQKHINSVMASINKNITAIKGGADRSPTEDIRAYGRHTWGVIKDLADMTKFYLDLGTEDRPPEKIPPDEAYEAMKDSDVKIMPGPKWKKAFEVIYLNNLLQKVTSGEALDEKGRQIYQAWQQVHQEADIRSKELPGGQGVGGVNYDQGMRQIEKAVAQFSQQLETGQPISPEQIDDMLNRMRHIGYDPDRLENRPEGQMLGKSELAFITAWRQLEQAKNADVETQRRLLTRLQQQSAVSDKEKQLGGALTYLGKRAQQPGEPAGNIGRFKDFPASPGEKPDLSRRVSRYADWRFHESVPPERLVNSDEAQKLLSGKGIEILSDEEVEKELVRRTYQRIKSGQIVTEPPTERTERGQSYKNIGDVKSAGTMKEINPEDEETLFWGALKGKGGEGYLPGEGGELPPITMPKSEKAVKENKKIVERYKKDPELFQDEILLPICRETTSLLVDKLTALTSGKRIFIPGVNLCPRTQSTDPAKLPGASRYKDLCSGDPKRPISTDMGAFGPCGFREFDPQHDEEGGPFAEEIGDLIVDFFDPMTFEEFVDEAAKQMLPYTGMKGGWQGPENEGKRHDIARRIVRLRMYIPLAARSQKRGGMAGEIEMEKHDSKAAAGKISETPLDGEERVEREKKRKMFQDLYADYSVEEIDEELQDIMAKKKRGIDQEGMRLAAVLRKAAELHQLGSASQQNLAQALDIEDEY